MPSTCHFILNKEDEVFFVNSDTVEGDVCLTTTKVKHIKSIELMFIGGSKCEFPAIDTPDYKHYANEVFVEEKQTIRGKGMLPAGKYIWSFCFNFSSVCQTSMESKYGHIRYQLYLKITNQGGKYDNIFIKPITVIKPFDLNNYSAFKAEQHCEVNTNCIFDVLRFRVYYSLATARSGFVPGQRLKYDLKVFHKSLQKIESYNFKFFRKTTYQTIGPQPYKRVVKTILHEEKIADNGINDQKHRGVLVIKSIPPTTFSGTLFFEYFIQVKAEILQSSSKFKAILPIIIGTVPERSSLTLHQGTWVDPKLVTSPDGERTLTYIITPPSYERAHRYEPAFRDSKALEINRVDGFLPFYPMYKSDEPSYLDDDDEY